MASLRSSFKPNAADEINGVFLEVANTRIRLARAGGSNAAYNAAVTKFATDNQRALQLGAMDDERAKSAFRDLYAQHIVTDWQTNMNDGKPGAPDWQVGIDDGEGGLVEVTFENIVAAFTEMPDLFLECKAFAEKLQYYRQAVVDDAIKNAKRS